MYSRAYQRATRKAIFLILIIPGIYVPYLIFTTSRLNDESTIKMPKSKSNEYLIRSITYCEDRKRQTRIEPRGDYIVLYNLLPAIKQFKCDQSITLTTHGDYTFLDNLAPLVERWQGPISVALYAPGYDFQATLDAIGYLRHCTNALIKELVTFHVFYESKHFPKDIKGGVRQLVYSLKTAKYDCTKWKSKRQFASVNRYKLYKTKRSLKYPINVARNIAIEAAQTHFVFASDIELMPSNGIIEKFLRMLVSKPYLEPQPSAINRHVYALPLFQVKKDSKIPSNKQELQKMFFKTKEAKFLKSDTCPLCHGIPNTDTWLKQQDDDELDVFTTVKRQGAQKHLEPFYIGTHNEPPFDERINWEGGRNKMIQAFTLCVLNYEIRVLDDVFVIYKPGKSRLSFKARLKDRISTANLIKMSILPELENLYGKRKECTMGNGLTKK